MMHDHSINYIEFKTTISLISLFEHVESIDPFESTFYYHIKDIDQRSDIDNVLSHLPNIKLSAETNSMCWINHKKIFASNRWKVHQLTPD